MNNKNKDIYEDLKNLVSEVLGSDVGDLTPEMTAHDVDGWDSLSHVKILYKCELKWNIRLTLEELSSLQNIGDLVMIIERSLK